MLPQCCFSNEPAGKKTPALKSWIMTNKEKRNYIKFKCDKDAVIAYLEDHGSDPKELRIDIRNDGYIVNWKTDFKGDLVSLMFDVVKEYSDVHDAVDGIYAFMLYYNQSHRSSMTDEEHEANKLKKTLYLKSTAQVRAMNMWNKDPNTVLPLLHKLLPKELWDRNPVHSFNTLKAFIGIDDNGDVGIALPEGITFKRPKSKEMKWQSFGSRKYIPYKIIDTSKPIHICFGMKEILLMELLQLNYLVFQSDTMVKHLTQAHIKLLQGKDVVIIPDNDLSCFKASTSLSNAIEAKSIRFINEFTEDKEDLVDYVNKHGVAKTLALLA